MDVDKKFSVVANDLTLSASRSERVERNCLHRGPLVRQRDTLRVKKAQE